MRQKISLLWRWAFLKPLIISCVLLSFLIAARAQEEEEVFAEKNEWLLEQQVMKEEVLPPDDERRQAAEDDRKNPLDLNRATEEELMQLLLLQPWQITNFLLYRKTLGSLLSLYELQAVPGWDEATIRKLRPFICIREAEAGLLPFFRRFKGGEGMMLWRMGKLLETTKPAAYVRYRYKLEKQLQWGIAGEKDAGENFFRGAQRKGFDFYSAHLFARNAGPFQALALGDFQVNMGQGLVQWQGMAFAAGAVLSAKKFSEVLQPYSSAGEFNFHRGIGLTLGKKRWQFTGFFSYRNLSARKETDSNGAFISGIVSSGYHRSGSEQATKNALELICYGGNLRFKKTGRHFGVNIVNYSFGHPFRKPDPLYKWFAITGKQWCNASVDYGITTRNLHFFGELAADKKGAPAFITGLMCNMSAALQAALCYRNFNRAYQGFFNSANAQNAAPSNEEGCMLRIDGQWQRKWKLQASLDRFRFPWLKYRVNGAANGYEYLIMVQHLPSRKLEWQFRYQLSNKPLNSAAMVSVMPFPALMKREQWRVQCSWTLSQRLRLTQRMDFLQAGEAGKPLRSSALSIWLDATCKLSGEWMFNTRLHLYDTDDYEARIYGYERDLLYSYSMPAFSGKAIRTYMLLRYKPFLKKSGKGLPGFECWVKYARSWMAAGVPAAGPEEEAPGDELRLQLMMNFR